jgi:hypothetical protein
MVGSVNQEFQRKGERSGRITDTYVEDVKIPRNLYPDGN